VIINKEFIRGHRTVEAVNIKFKGTSNVQKIVNRVLSLGKEVNTSEHMISYVDDDTLWFICEGKPESGESIAELFLFFNNVRCIDISALDTSKCTNMSGTFSHCNKLRRVEFGNINTSNVATMSNLFDCDSELRDVNMSNLDLHSLVDAALMFNYCTNLKYIDFRGLNTQSVVTTSHMFNYCRQLRKVNLDGLDLRNVASMSNMFCDCDKLKYINFDAEVRDLENIEGMFYNCGLIESFKLNKGKTIKMTSIHSAFSGCKSLTYLDLSSIDLSDGSVDCARFLWDCKKIKYLNIENFRNKQLKVINTSGYIVYSPKKKVFMEESIVPEELICKDKDLYDKIKCAEEIKEFW